MASFWAAKNFPLNSCTTVTNATSGINLDVVDLFVNLPIVGVDYWCGAGATGGTPGICCGLCPDVGLSRFSSEHDVS